MDPSTMKLGASERAGEKLIAQLDSLRDRLYTLNNATADISSRLFGAEPEGPSDPRPDHGEWVGEAGAFERCIMDLHRTVDEINHNVDRIGKF